MYGGQERKKKAAVANNGQNSDKDTEANSGQKNKTNDTAEAGVCTVVGSPLQNALSI